ncbi:MAG: hypothetical protein SFW63_02590 [Alphaproteobacteria bacterium]|nr:hypothetical protein [Alphaproteobacteria bacterium]
MDKSLTENPTPSNIGSGWKTGSMIQKEQGGHGPKWNERIQTLGEALVGDIVASTDMPESEAREIVNTHLVGIRLAANNFQAIAASKVAQRLLPELEKHPIMEDGWKTGSMLRHEQGGGLKAWNEKITKLREALVGDVIKSTGYSKKEAELIVDKHLIGERLNSGEPVTAISPDAERLLEERPKLPEIEEGWRTASMIRKDQGGDNKTWQKRIQKLRGALILDIVESTGCSHEESLKLVTDHLIGLRSSSGMPAMAMSKDAQRQIPEIKPREPKGITPALIPQPKPLEDDWLTGNQMMQKHGGDPRVWNKRIEDLSHALVGDIIKSSQVSEQEARSIVEHNLIGMRLPNRGPAAPSVSPDAQRILEGKLVKPLKDGWQNGNMLGKEFVGDGRTWNDRIQQLAKALSGDIVKATGMYEKEASAIVEEHLIGLRQPARSVPATAVSPDAKRILVEKYQPTKRGDVSGDSPLR